MLHDIELFMQYSKSILCYSRTVESRIDCQEQSQRNSECIECCLKIDLQLDYISSSGNSTVVCRYLHYRLAPNCKYDLPVRLIILVIS